MTELILAAIFFTGFHLVVSGTPLRARLVAVLGERPYQGLFSLISLIGILWLVRAYAGVEHIELWGQLAVLKPAMLVIVLLAMLFAVIGLTTPGPTTVGAEALLKRDEPARGIHRVSRHPFMWGVALWALGHLVVNGDAGSLVFFGSLLILALAGTFSIDAKRKRAFGEDWTRYANATSNVPFQAVIQGRNRLLLGEIGWWRPLTALVVYGTVMHFHVALFGVSAVG